MKITMLFLLYINQNTALKHLIQQILTWCAVLFDVDWSMRFEWYKTYPRGHERIAAKIAHLRLIVGTALQVRGVPHRSTDLTCNTGPGISGPRSHRNVLMYIKKYNNSKAQRTKNRNINFVSLAYPTLWWQTNMLYFVKN